MLPGSSSASSDHAAHFRGATALVTGGAGFIGSHIVDALLAAGARVRVLDDLSTGSRRNVPAAAELMIGSVSDSAAVGRAASGCTHVFHLAAMVGILQSVHEPAKHFDSNVVGTELVLRACADAKVAGVVFTSSSAVYGTTPSLPSREGDAIQAANPYAAGKAAGELLTESYASVHDAHAASLRLFNVFGPRQSAAGAYAAVIAAFFAAAQAKQPAPIFGTGEQTRDFVPVADVVQAFLRAADERRGLRGERFNVGLGRATALRDLQSAIAGITGTRIPPRALPPRDGDSLHSCADISKARSILDFDPRVSMAEGLDRTWQWLLADRG